MYKYSKSKLSTILLAIEHTKSPTTDTFIFTNNLNNIYICPAKPAQDNHPGKLLIAHIIHAIKKNPYTTYPSKKFVPIQSSMAMMKLTKLAKTQIVETPFHLIGHQTMLWPSIPPTSAQHNGLPRNLKWYIEIEYKSELI